jgi:hypothetical protein
LSIVVHPVMTGGHDQGTGRKVLRRSLCDCFSEQWGGITVHQIEERLAVLERRFCRDLEILQVLQEGKMPVLGECAVHCGEICAHPVELGLKKGGGRKKPCHPVCRWDWIPASAGMTF